MPEANVTTGLRIQRKKRKLSLADAAKGIGVPKATLSRWETGERTPTLAYWPAIEKVIGVKVSAESLRKLPVGEAA